MWIKMEKNPSLERGSPLTSENILKSNNVGKNRDYFKSNFVIIPPRKIK